ncbi:hypothetical protein [Methanothrix sp.]|uniref:hypothetical protein n=1 Tax=Methanothrix sp. TaxID=90426 RepID=UPI003C751BF4
MLIDTIDWNLIWKDAFLASRLTGDNYYGLEKGAQSYDSSENIWTDGEGRSLPWSLTPPGRCWTSERGRGRWPSPWPAGCGG